MQYMTHRNRRGRIERGAQLYNQREEARIVPLLCGMARKAARHHELAARKQAGVLDQLQQQHGVGSEEVGASLVEKRGPVCPHIALCICRQP